MLMASACDPLGTLLYLDVVLKSTLFLNNSCLICATCLTSAGWGTERAGHGRQIVNLRTEQYVILPRGAL